MLISASRRTDIPTYYSEWLYNRIHDGYVLVRNPMNAHQIGRVSLSPDVVDGIVFWTKNPTPMLGRLDELKDYNYYFQFTLNPYSKDIEPNIPSKNDVIIPTFLKLSEAIGTDRVIWRYDPIILSEKYTLEYHLEYFEKLAHILASHARKCTFSFLDLYKNTKKNVRSLNLRPISSEDVITLAKGFHEIALGYGLKLDTCAEQIDLSDFRISHAHCIDKNIFEQFCGCPLKIDKDKNQRPECGCVASIDIGAYNTCVNGCYYCYANFNSKAAATNYAKHDPLSPLLFGTVGDDDVIKDRAMSSCKVLQQQLFF